MILDTIHNPDSLERVMVNKTNLLLNAFFAADRKIIYTMTAPSRKKISEINSKAGIDSIIAFLSGKKVKDTIFDRNLQGIQCFTNRNDTCVLSWFTIAYIFNADCKLEFCYDDFTKSKFYGYKEMSFRLGDYALIVGEKRISILAPYPD